MFNAWGHSEIHKIVISYQRWITGNEKFLRSGSGRPATDAEIAFNTNRAQQAKRLGEERERIIEALLRLDTAHTLRKEEEAGLDLALLNACETSDNEIARLLVLAGANVNAQEYSTGMPAALIACNNGMEDLLAFALDRDLNPHIAADNGVSLLSALENGPLSDSLKERIRKKAAEMPAPVQADTHPSANRCLAYAFRMLNGGLRSFDR